MKFAINAPDSAKLLFKDICSQKMNGGALFVHQSESGEFLDPGSCAEISRACDRFWAKRRQIVEFLRWQKFYRRQKQVQS